MNLELRHDRDASCFYRIASGSDANRSYCCRIVDTSWNGVANGLGFVGIVVFGLGFQSKSARTVSVREGASGVRSTNVCKSCGISEDARILAKRQILGSRIKVFDTMPRDVRDQCAGFRARPRFTPGFRGCND
ncbi:hypothetical protein F2Q69_00042379 [Brassica cretica]|uniref:Uncharacterized protein n=1 Tax=Brassica cretica TaxID=69181 RepID=A0A8S9N996_BRACR|nr:hypothetical protein F2Q69_00042379 [Brassica cretica]